MINFEQTWPILLLSFSSSFDNLSVGLALGIGGFEVPVSVNCWISLCNSIVMAVCAVFGEEIGEKLPARMPGVLSGLIFILVGIFSFSSSDQFTIDSIAKKNEKTSTEDEDELIELTAEHENADPELGTLELSGTSKLRNRNYCHQKSAFHDRFMVSLQSSEEEGLIHEATKRHKTNYSEDSRDIICPENPQSVSEKNSLSDSKAKNSDIVEGATPKANKKFMKAGMCSREIWMLAFSVSVSNVAAGIGAGIIKLDALQLFIWVFVASFGLFWIGMRCGTNARKCLTPTIVSLAASCILISLGLAQIFLD